MSTEPTIPPATVPSALLPEILGFSPQLLLDDIINIANDAVIVTVDGMEGFLNRWADERAAKPEYADWDSTQEVEQGLVAFQTLLESHTDIAFDFLEVWSLRNIFAFPPDLPVVVPHQKGLDLDSDAESERQLLEEIDSLREKISNQRRLKRLFTRAARKSSQQLQYSRDRHAKLSFLDVPDLETISRLSSKFSDMFTSVSSLPPRDPSQTPAPSILKDPGKRDWETNKTGYQRWAASALMKKAGKGVGEVQSIRDIDEIGRTAWIKELTAAEEVANDE